MLPSIRTKHRRPAGAAGRRAGGRAPAGAALRRAALVAAAVLGCLLGASGAFAQSGGGQPGERRYATGADMPTEEEIKDLPVVELTRAYIPEAISLADRFPVPGDQGKTSTCVAWATAYAARSYYNSLHSGASGRPEASQIASPAYLHNIMFSHLSRQHPGISCDKLGSKIPLAMAVLREHGAMSEQDYAFKQRICEAVPSLDAGRAAQNKIANAQTVSHRPAVPLNLDKVKLKLAEGHPVVFGMQVGDTFERLPAGTVYNSTVAELRESNPSGHAMVVIGYDERRQAFHVLNSWGPAWADSGYGWISYRSFKADVTNAFVMDVAGVTPVRPVPTRPPASEPPRPQELAQLNCADVRRAPAYERKALRYTGFVSSPKDLDAINDAVDDIRFAGSVDVESDVKLRPWPVCEALLTLREPLLAASRPKVDVVGGRPVRQVGRNRPADADVALKVGDQYSIRITAPDVPAFLYAFYIEDDGTVVNVAPRTGPIRRQTPPGEQVVIGGGGKSSTITVTPPPSGLDRGEALRGHEAIVVIAARAPIQELEDREDEEAKRNPRNRYYRASAKDPGAQGPPDRLLLSLLRDITLQRAEPTLLPREVSAAVVHIKIEE